MQEFDRFMEVVRTIREKCPWDSVQTHESLKKYLVEESQEVLDGIDRLNRTGDSDNLCEELGDVLFQVALHRKRGFLRSGMLFPESPIR